MSTPDTTLIDPLGIGTPMARWIRWRLLKRRYEVRRCLFRSTRTIGRAA